jgi:hypothetical protein
MSELERQSLGAKSNPRFVDTEILDSEESTSSQA